MQRPVLLALPPCLAACGDDSHAREVREDPSDNREYGHEQREDLAVALVVRLAGVRGRGVLR